MSYLFDSLRFDLTFGYIPSNRSFRNTLHNYYFIRKPHVYMTNFDVYRASKYNLLSKTGKVLLLINPNIIQHSIFYY